jgi:hypothetical protein
MHAERTSPNAKYMRGILTVLALAAVVVAMLLFGQRLNRQENERRLGERRLRDLASIKEGRAEETLIYDPELLLMIVADADAAANATSLVFSNVDFSDKRFAAISRLEALQNLGIASSKNADAVLNYAQGMESIEKIWIEKSPVSEAGISALTTLPNLKQVRFEQAMSAEQSELLRSTLPDVKIDIPFSE